MFYKPVLVAKLLGCAALLKAQQGEVMTERGVSATMRDGTVLKADIYRPKASGRYPVLLQRTPSQFCEPNTMDQRYQYRPARRRISVSTDFARNQVGMSGRQSCRQASF